MLVRTVVRVGVVVVGGVAGVGVRVLVGALALVQRPTNSVSNQTTTVSKQISLLLQLKVFFEKSERRLFCPELIFWKFCDFLKLVRSGFLLSLACCDES